VWRVRWDKGRHSATFTTRAEASAFAADLFGKGFRDPRKQSATGFGRLTFEQAAEKYFGELSVLPRTLAEYRRMAAKHVCAAIGDMAVGDVGAADLGRVFRRTFATAVRDRGMPE
jgi:hypothetical protein